MREQWTTTAYITKEGADPPKKGADPASDAGGDDTLDGETTDLVVECAPGHVYIAMVSGCEHQVVHCDNVPEYMCELINTPFNHCKGQR